MSVLDTCFLIVRNYVLMWLQNANNIIQDIFYFLFLLPETKIKRLPNKAKKLVKILVSKHLLLLRISLNRTEVS
jgi:hypothetical protein